MFLLQYPTKLMFFILIQCFMLIIVFVLIFAEFEIRNYGYTKHTMNNQLTNLSVFLYSIPRQIFINQS